jgi:hypothetical protein
VAALDDGTSASQSASTEQQQQQQQQTVLDQSQLWSDIAAASFGADGVMDGWDSDTEQPKSSESKYLQVSIVTQQAASCGRSAAAACAGGSHPEAIHYLPDSS